MNTAGGIGCLTSPLPNPFLLAISNMEPKKTKKDPPSLPWRPCDIILSRKNECMFRESEGKAFEKMFIFLMKGIDFPCSTSLSPSSLFQNRMLNMNSGSLAVILKRIKGQYTKHSGVKKEICFLWVSLVTGPRPGAAQIQASYFMKKNNDTVCISHF